MLPIAFAASEKRTADYVRRGTTNLFAALNVTTGEVLGECMPTRNGKDFLTFLKRAVKPHEGKDIHVVLDNLSTHNTSEVRQWLAKNPHVHFHFTPVGSSWLNQIEIWFGILTRQSIRRGTFSSVNVVGHERLGRLGHRGQQGPQVVVAGRADLTGIEPPQNGAQSLLARDPVAAAQRMVGQTESGQLSGAARLHHSGAAVMESWPAGVIAQTTRATSEETR